MENRQKIALISPIEPYRSGIAKHSTQVALTLSQNKDISLDVYSFKRLYPAFLFPGADDKDSESSSPEQLNVDVQLDAINPFSWFSLCKKLKKEKYSAVIIPAWTFFVAPCLGYISKQCKKHGIKVVSIVHNAFDHEASGLKNSLMRYQLKSSSEFLCHNKSLAKQIYAELPNANVLISPHPIFDQYPEPTELLEKRAPLELLFFGIIRDYKGLDILIDAVAKLDKDSFKLTIVGECWGSWDKYQEQIDSLGLKGNIETVIQYASDEDAANYFTRADVVVLPYRSMTGTGVIPLAYNFETPVICSKLDAFYEVVDEGESGVIAEGGNANDITQAINKFVALRNSVDFEKNTREIAKTFTWENFCIALLTLIKSKKS